MDTIASIQKAQPEDIPPLSEYWYDKMALAQQFNPKLHLPSDAQLAWIAQATQWLKLPTGMFLVAHGHESLLGAIVGWIEAIPQGSSGTRIGIVRDLILDLHMPQHQHGVAQRLWQTLKPYFISQNIQRLLIHVTPHLLVEEAFWRAMGALPQQNLFRMDVIL